MRKAYSCCTSQEYFIILVDTARGVLLLLDRSAESVKILRRRGRREQHQVPAAALTVSPGSLVKSFEVQKLAVIDCHFLLLTSFYQSR